MSINIALRLHLFLLGLQVRLPRDPLSSAQGLLQSILVDGRCREQAKKS
jgi:hypothetical protein